MVTIIRRFFNMLYVSPDKTVTVTHIGGAAVAAVHGTAANVMVS